MRPPDIDSQPRWMARRPLPEVERRLRGSFPELWIRYERLAASRGRGGLGPPAGRGGAPSLGSA
jgi:hypothetical protein